MAAASASVRSGEECAANPEARLRGALWGLFAADALAAPSHWYYGGFPQVQGDYGRRGIAGYTKPVMQLRGSILNKSNTSGAGRGAWSASKSIVGDVINHGKKDLWHPSKSIHYHATLEAGENTLEASLVRVLMRSVVSQGAFDPDHFRAAYVDFMQRPGSHNDTYASTCHRMFFANLIFKKLPPEACPDNDQHNVDTMDGLILPMAASLSLAGSADAAPEDLAARAAAVTRRSAVLERTSGVVAHVLLDIVRGVPLEQSMDRVTAAFGGFRPNPRSSDQMTACYLDSALPATLDMAAKYGPNTDVWTALLANANVGGENVHRGAVLGMLLGANAGVGTLPAQLIDGLHHSDELRHEIDAFANVVFRGGQANTASA